ncbi:hypothetical protein FS837_001145, partial [Tulasnella sp. UAMH 9824]
MYSAVERSIGTGTICFSKLKHGGIAVRSGTAATAPKTKPFVTVTWDSGYYPDKPLRSAGLLSVPATPNASNYSSVVAWGTDSPREWKHGITFNLTAGQNFEVDLGRRRIYGNRAGLLDLIGVGQSPDVFATYPIRECQLYRTYVLVDSANLNVSVVADLVSIDSSNSSRPNRTEINFYPAFGAYDDEIIEEYLENTVLSGMSATGGLYSTFDVAFMFLFGRSLMVALF